MKLLPCPFCGGEPSIQKARWPRARLKTDTLSMEWWVECLKCNAKIDHEDVFTKREAYNHWNTRIATPLNKG